MAGTIAEIFGVGQKEVAHFGLGREKGPVYLSAPGP